MNLSSPRAVCSAINGKQNTQLVVNALELAIEAHRYLKGLPFHSDPGPQYRSQGFRRILWRNRIQQSSSRRENCWGSVQSSRGGRCRTHTSSGSTEPIVTKCWIYICPLACLECGILRATGERNTTTNRHSMPCRIWRLSSI